MVGERWLGGHEVGTLAGASFSFWLDLPGYRDEAKAEGLDLGSPHPICHVLGEPLKSGHVDHYEKKSAGYAVKYGRIRFAVLHLDRRERTSWAQEEWNRGTSNRPPAGEFLDHSSSGWS